MVKKELRATYNERNQLAIFLTKIFPYEITIDPRIKNTSKRWVLCLKINEHRLYWHLSTYQYNQFFKGVEISENKWTPEITHKGKYKLLHDLTTDDIYYLMTQNSKDGITRNRTKATRNARTQAVLGSVDTGG